MVQDTIVRHKRKILFISPKEPFPLNDGAKIRIWQSLYFLSKMFVVDLVYITSDRNTNENEINKGIANLVEHSFSYHISKYEFILNIFRSFTNKSPIRNNVFYSRKMQKWIDNNIASYDAVYCHGYRTFEYVLKYGIKDLFVDFVDALSMNYEKAMLCSSFVYSLYCKIDFKRICRFEELILKTVKNCSIISCVDKDYLVKRIGCDASKLTVVGNMVKKTEHVCVPSKTIGTILFVGMMSYEPNVVAVTNFANNVLPVLKKEFPEIKFYIAGAFPSEKVKKLANNNVIVTGYVDSLYELYDRASVVIAPMLTGAGIQNKIIQAMSLGCCVLTTTIGAEGLTINDNELVIADGNIAIAEKISWLLRHPAERDAIGENARSYVLDSMNEVTIFNNFVEFIMR